MNALSGSYSDTWIQQIQQELELLIKILPKNIISPVKVRDKHRIKKKNSISIIIFGYENKEKYPKYV